MGNKTILKTNEIDEDNFCELAHVKSEFVY